MKRTAMMNRTAMIHRVANSLEVPYRFSPVNYDRRSLLKSAGTNQQIAEMPHNFHQVVLQPPQAKRKEYPFEGYIDFQGLGIDIENAKGSVRSGKNPDGSAWTTRMFAHYGELRNTEGVDKDKIDVYVGDNADSSLVLVVHQFDPGTGLYDEDKVMIGFDSIEEAIGLFRKQYDKPGYYRGEHTAMPIGTLKRWVEEGKNKGKRIKLAQVAKNVAKRWGDVW